MITKTKSARLTAVALAEAVSRAAIATLVLSVALIGQSQGLDPELLTKPPTDAWPTYNGDYSGRRFSTLNQINAANVKNLTLAWIYRANPSVANAMSAGEGPEAKE